MRILLFALNFPPELTGAAVTTAGRVRHLIHRGHQVTVIAGFPHYPAWRVLEGYRHFRMKESIDGAEVVRRWHHVPARNAAPGRVLLEASFAATAVPTGLTATRPDVVLSVMPAVAAGLAGMLTARRFAVPHGIFVLDLSGRAAEQSGMAGGRLARRLAEPLERAILRGASRVGVITEGFRVPLLEMGVSRDRIDLMRDWKEPHTLSRSRENVRERLGLPLDSPLALHSGNMGSKQGLEHVLRAAVLAGVEWPELRFVLVGGGSERERLKSEAAQLGLKNVVFLDLVPPEVFPSLLGSADVLLLNQRASVVEMSMPSKLVDYFASGRPVVAAVNSKSEAAKEVARAHAGTVVPPEDPRQLLGAIRAMVEDAELASRMGRAAQTYISKHNARGILEESLDRFLQDLVTSG